MATKTNGRIDTASISVDDSRALADTMLTLHEWAAEKAAHGNDDATFVFQMTARVYFSALRAKE